MLVRYNQLGAHYIELTTQTKSLIDPSIPAKFIKEEFESLTLTREFIIFVPGDKDKFGNLFGGVHQLTKDEWAVVSHHAKALIASGGLVPIEIDSAKTKGGTAKKAETLGEVPNEQAVLLIQQCFDVYTLKKWKGDKRSDIRRMVNTQMEMILKRDNKSVDSDDFDLDDVAGE